MAKNSQYNADYFIKSRQIPEQSNTEDLDSSLFKKQISIPPIGIAEPKLVEKSHEYIEEPEKLQSYIEDLEKYKKETPQERVKRESEAHKARFTEGLGGFWGNMQEFMTALTGIGYQEKEQPTKEELSKFRFPSIESIEGQRFSKHLPTTKELRQTHKEQTGEYLEPKNEKEKATHEVAQDIGELFAVPGGMSWIEKIMMPIVGQVSKQTVKAFGGSEAAQDWTKLLTMQASSILRLGNAPRVASQAIREAENMIPRGLSFNSQPIERNLQRIINSNWYQSGRTTAKGPAFDEITRIQNQIRNGRINGRMAMQLRHDINAARNTLGAFKLPRGERRQAMYYLDQVDEALLSGMEQYGQNVNPQWWRNYRLANEAFRITRRSQALSDYIHDNGARKFISETGKYLFAPAMTVLGTTMPLTALGVGTGLGVAKTIQISNRLIQSRVLRHHYANVMRYAAQNNIPALRKELEKFDVISKKIEDQESKKSPKKKVPMQ